MQSTRLLRTWIAALGLACATPAVAQDTTLPAWVFRPVQSLVAEGFMRFLEQANAEGCGLMQTPLACGIHWAEPGRRAPESIATLHRLPDPKR